LITVFLAVVLSASAVDAAAEPLTPPPNAPAVEERQDLVAPPLPEPVSPPSVSITDAPPSASFRMGRLVVESLAGLGTGLVGFTGAGLIMFGIAGLSGGGGGLSLPAAILGGVVMVASTLFTVPLGTYLAGNWMDGRGKYGWALLGNFVGAAASLLVLSASSGQLWGYSLILMPLCSSIAYELSSYSNEPAPASPVPYVALLPSGGAAFGVASRF
jgi:hypothetical protein